MFRAWFGPETGRVSVDLRAKWLGGNTFTHFQQIFEPMRDPKTGREVHKSVFAARCTSKSAENLALTLVSGRLSPFFHRFRPLCGPFA